MNNTETLFVAGRLCKVAAADHQRRNTALGALAGEGLGAAGGSVAGAAIADKMSRNPDWETRALGRFKLSYPKELGMSATGEAAADLSVARIAAQLKGGLGLGLVGGAAGMVGGGMIAHRMSRPEPSRLQQLLNMVQSRKHQ